MRTFNRFVFVAGLAAAAASCGDVVRSSRAPVILVIDSLEGARGSNPTQFFSNLISDVLTLVTSGGVCTTTNPCPTVFGDPGQAVLHIVPKDIGPVGTTVTPSTNNEVTITRVHVEFVRTDGHNIQGVDVPYAFDTGATGTVPASGQLTIGFPIVRVQAKEESPLIELETNGQVFSAIANITFYGQDQVGNQLSVTGSMSVDFGDFGDE